MLERPLKILRECQSSDPESALLDDTWRGSARRSSDP
jgi:hypothetical protein